MAQINETDGSLHAFEYRKIKRVCDLNSSKGSNIELNVICITTAYIETSL